MPLPIRHILALLMLLAGAGLFLFLPRPNPDAATLIDTPTRTYSNGDHNFHFKYPTDANIDSFTDGDTEVILLTRPGEILELHITPSDATRLTEADIREAVGADVIRDLTTSLLALGIPLLRADVLLSDMGPIPHAWFLRRGYRYQVLANPQARRLLDNFLASFCFRDVPLPIDQVCSGKPTP